MKLYNGMAPNSLRVTIFLTEKGIEIPVEETAPLNGDTRTEGFLQINSLGEIPVLELDSGEIITESIAICRYLEELHPEPPLFGSTAVERARVEMWNRRIEFHIFGPIGDVGRHEFELFKSRGQVAEYAAFCREVFPQKLAWLDSEISDGRPFIAGDNFSVADITAAAAMMVAEFAQVKIPDDLGFVQKWMRTVQTRPSFPKPPS